MNTEMNNDISRGYEQDQEADRLYTDYHEYLKVCSGTDLILKVADLIKKTDKINDLISNSEKDLLIDLILYIDGTGAYDDSFRDNL